MAYDTAACPMTLESHLESCLPFNPRGYTPLTMPADDPAAWTLLPGPCYLWAQARHDSGTFCNADPSICEATGEVCFYFADNPDGGTISFDSTPQAMLPILQAITFDMWTDPMFDVMDAHSYSSCFYFLMIATLGGMYAQHMAFSQHCHRPRLQSHHTNLQLPA